MHSAFDHVDQWFHDWSKSRFSVPTYLASGTLMYSTASALNVLQTLTGITLAFTAAGTLLWQIFGKQRKFEAIAAALQNENAGLIVKADRLEEKSTRLEEKNASLVESQARQEAELIRLRESGHDLRDKIQGNTNRATEAAIKADAALSLASQGAEGSDVAKAIKEAMTPDARADH